MRKLLHLVLIVLLGLSLMMAGCAAKGESEDSARTKGEATMVGAGGGAILGAILGGLIGGDATSAVKGAAIGAAVGGVAGYAYGTHVAEEKAKYASEEDWLNAAVGSARQTNQETRAYNRQLRVELAKLDKETKHMAAAYKAKKIKRASMLAKKKALDAKLKTANKKLGKAKWELENQETVVAESKDGKGNPALKKEIAQLKKQIKELEASTQSLAAMSQRMSV
jgi:hypothetical protein